MSTPNYKLHPFDISEKFKMARGDNKPFAILRVVFGQEMPPEIVEAYKIQIIQHNDLQLSSKFSPIGFELITPKDIEFEWPIQKVDFGIKAEMWYADKDGFEFTAFDILPNTTLMGSQTTVIEPSFRENLFMVYRKMRLPPIPGCLYDDPYVLKSGTKPAKIYHPSRCPIYVTILENESELTNVGRNVVVP